MFKSLLQTIPTISGNFTLACKLNNYEHDNNFEYTSYINDAILMPLDNNYNLTRDIKINLINGKYEYDVNKYFKEMFAYFYNDTYLKNSNIFETYPEDYLSLPDNRDKNFEFGCKRISYHKYKYQYQFFAPIYINDIEDLPDEFVIEIFNNNSIVKKIHIPINKKVAKNKLRIYLSKFIEKIQNNIPVIWNFEDNKIIYKNVIDCQNGGLITISSYNTIQNKNIYQTIINDIDNLICQNYKQNKIILSECIPLSFIFNIDDLLGNNDLYYYHFNDFNILGYYTKNKSKCKYYTFSTNYHNNYQSYSSFDNLTGSLINKEYNIFDNDIVYSLKEGTNYKLYYQNTFKNKYFQWKLVESDSYIINLNSVFTYNSIQNKFPVLKNVLLTYPQTLFNNDILYLPIHNYINIFSQQDINQYNILLNNNYTNWFNIYEGNFGAENDTYQQYIKENYKEILKEVHNNYVFINGIRYYINDNKVKYFGIYINPIKEPYDENIIVGDVILEKKLDSNKFVYYSYLEETNNFYKPIENKIIEEKYETSPEEEVYILFDQKIKYFEYNEDIINDLFYGENMHKISSYNIINRQSFISSIKSLYNLSDEDIDQKLNEIYYNKYQNIFNNYFKISIGYQKLDISLNNFSENELQKIFKSNKSLIDNLYYSLPNVKTKNNLYYDLINQKTDYELLLNNNVTLFIKKKFVEINNSNKFLNVLFNQNGLFTKIYTFYTQNNSINNSEHILNTFIDIINVYMNNYKNNQNNIDISWLSDDSVFIQNNIYILDEIDSTYESDITFRVKINNFYNELLDLIIYLTIFVDINWYCDQYNINLYKYVPYYNDNNILINYDYYEKIYDKRNYTYLYTNIIPELNNIDEINQLKKSIYVHINDLNTLKYYLNEFNYYNDEQLKQIFFNKQTNINKNLLVEETEIIPLDQYILKSIKTLILNYINKHIEQLNNESENIDSNGNKIYQYTEENYKCDFENIIYNSKLTFKDLLEKYIIENNNKFLFDIVYLMYNEQVYPQDETSDNFKEYIYLLQKENGNIDLDIYIKLDNVYLLTDNINNYIDNIKNYIDNINNEEYSNIYNNLEKEPYIIYKEQPIKVNNSSIILTDIIYNDFSINKCQNFKYQQILKNINKINNYLYVYENPYNYLVKTTINDYWNNYKNDNIIPYSYYRLNDINELDINYIDKGEYSYLCINYHIMMSTNLFNIHNVDNNDNFEIKNINNILITDINFKEIFKKIYPYLKQDILINLIAKINNQTHIYNQNNELISNPIKIILPNNIKCNINTIVNKKPDDEKFTNIFLSKDIVKVLYLNRYFGNIDPYFKEIKYNLNYIRSKIYTYNDINTNINCDNNNVYIENINIYNYNKIPYYIYENNEQVLKFISQLEYKHFNNNYWVNLPIEIQFNPSDIDYVYKNELSNYINSDKCFKYFKEYLQNNYFNCKSIKNENLFLYIFNKYSIEYIQYKEQEKVFKDAYKITYKLTLL